MMKATLVSGVGLFTFLSLTAVTADKDGSSLWLPQYLPSPYEGQYTGITWADLNHDGHPDLLISAGKHWIDQPYVLIHLGSSHRGVRWSDPLPLGPPAGYYAVRAGRFSFLPSNTWGVLLAGGDCNTVERNQFGRCVLGSPSPAVLLQVSVRRCSAQRPGGRCELDWDVVWQDAARRGDRNGALAYDLGDGVDPAIVLTGNGGVAIFEPPYSSRPTFTIRPQEKLAQSDDPISRGTGLAVGPIGTRYTGFFVGTRTHQAAPPAPLVGVWKTAEADYSWYIMLENNEYWGDPGSTAVQATGLALADLNGDGILDIIEANHLSSDSRVNEVSVQQDYSLLDEEGFPIQVTTFSWEDRGGRTVDAGNLFTDSDLPDVVLGTSRGQIVLFANLGLDSEGDFRGLEERHRFDTVADCEVRQAVIVPDLLRPCAPSIAAVVFCPRRPDAGGVFLFHHTGASPCPTTPRPTARPAPAPHRPPHNGAPNSLLVPGRRTPQPMDPNNGDTVDVLDPTLDNTAVGIQGDPLASSGRPMYWGSTAGALMSLLLGVLVWCT